MYIEKLMMIILFTHKLVVAAVHYPGLCWQFKRGFLNPWKPSSAPPAVLVSLLPVCQMFMSSAWILFFFFFFCFFLCKAMWSTAHGYYSAGAGHSVALKLFEERDLFINKNICYTKHIYTTLMLHTERRGLKIYIYMNSKFLHDMLVNWLYSCDGLLLWNLSWKEPV